MKGSYNDVKLSFKATSSKLLIFCLLILSTSGFPSVVDETEVRMLYDS